jgi:integrase
VGKKSKRANGDADVYPRKNRRGEVTGYRGPYWVQTERGPKRRTVSGKTKTETRAKLAKAKAEADIGLAFDAGTVNVSEYLKRWLEDSKDTVRPRTWERYEQNSRVHIVPALGSVRLKALTPAHLRGLYRRKLEAGLAPRTVNYIHQTLHKALRQAVADGLVPRNVAVFVKAPRPAKREMRYLDPQQAEALLEAAREDRLEALYVLAIRTGMRQGELLGLSWQDVDLETGALQVRRTLASTKGGVAVYNPPKSGRGRSLELSEKTVEALRRHRAAQNEERLGLGSLWEDHGLVFADPWGKPIRRWTLDRRSFVPLLERAGLADAVTFHGLRHTFATTMLKGGVHAKVVSEMLGHADVALTLNVYSHVLPGMQAEAARRIDELLA